MTIKRPTRLPLIALITASSLVLGACSSTSDIAAAAPVTLLSTQAQSADANYVRVAESCQSQVLEREQAIASGAQASAQLALANAALRCIEDIHFSARHPDKQTAMRFNALAVLNFVKAGELTQAQTHLDAFKQRFPQQDLVFADYSSFVDTATALLQKQGLSARQMKLLNISPQLRDELARAQHWSTN